MKRVLSFTSLLVLVFFVALTTTVSAQSYFENKPIYMFGEPDISKMYESNASIWTPSYYAGNWSTFVEVNLTIQNPQSIQFYVNGNVVSTNSFDTNTWILDYDFQPSTNYFITVRVKYSQHYNNNTCGTWSTWIDGVVGL